MGTSKSSTLSFPYSAWIDWIASEMSLIWSWKVSSRLVDVTLLRTQSRSKKQILTKMHSVRFLVLFLTSLLLLSSQLILSELLLILLKDLTQESLLWKLVIFTELSSIPEWCRLATPLILGPPWLPPWHSVYPPRLLDTSTLHPKTKLINLTVNTNFFQPHPQNSTSVFWFVWHSLQADWMRSPGYFWPNTGISTWVR